MPGQRVRPYFGHPQVPVEDQRHRVNLELLPEPPPRSSAQSRATSAALSSPSRWYTVQRRQPRSPVTPSWAAAAGMRCSSGWPAARTWIRVVERAASAPSGSGWVDQRQPATANCPRTVTQPATHRPGRCRDRSAEQVPAAVRAAAVASSPRRPSWWMPSRLELAALVAAKRRVLARPVRRSRLAALGFDGLEAERQRAGVASRGSVS